MRCILLIFITRHTEYRKLLSLLCIFFIHGFNYLPVWRVCVLLTHLFIFLGSDIRRRCTLQDGYSTVICHNALLGSSKFRWRDLHRAFYIKNSQSSINKIIVLRQSEISNTHTSETFQIQEIHSVELEVCPMQLFHF